MAYLGGIAYFALLIALGIWIAILDFKSDKERGLMPSFADFVDTAGCIAVLIVVTNWLDLWDSDPTPDPGVDLARPVGGLLKGVFLIILPSMFALHFMRRLGGLARRATIYGCILAVAVAVSFIRD